MATSITMSAPISWERCGSRNRLTANSELTSGGVPIFYAVSLGGLLLTATAGGNTVFTITLNPDGSLANSNDTYTLNMTGIVDTQSEINFNDGTYDFTGGNTGWGGFVPDGQGFGQTPVSDGSDDLLLTPVGAGTSINGNANAAGVSGGTGPGSGGLFIGTNEGIRLDFVNDLTGDPAGGDFPANSDFVFLDHYDANGAAVTIGGVNTGSAAARFTAKNDSDVFGGVVGENGVNDGVEEAITSIAIRFGGETGLVVLADDVVIVNPIEVGNQDFTVTRDPDGMSVVVDGLVTGVTIATYTADGFNSLEVTYVSGNPFIITGFGTSAVLSDPVISKCLWNSWMATETSPPRALM